MSFPRYPKYKDSGVEWLGEVPDGWAIKAVRHTYNVVGGSTPKSDVQDYWDGDVVWITPADLSKLESFEIRVSMRTLTQEGLNSCGTTVVPIGSVILSTRAPIGSLGIAAVALCTNQGCKALVPSEGQNSRFFAYCLVASNEALNVRGKGTTFLELSGDELGSFRVPNPSSAEQQAIAAFLDRETAKIDALVAEQENLIALLKEKRQAVISHAVTKGLDPTVPMKDSGIEWLGEVPAHWTRLQIGKICNQVSDGPHFSPSYVSDGVMFLSARNIKVDGWSLDDAKYISEDDYVDFSKRIIPEVEDILYTKGGTTGIARVADFDEKFQVWVHVAVLKIKREIANPQFVAYSLNSAGCYEQAQLFTRGATNNDLGLTRLIKIWFALPTIDEQQAIVSHLDSETAKLDDLTTEAQRTIDLLKERRSALISAAVTGKIDIRGYHVHSQPIT